MANPWMPGLTHDPGRSAGYNAGEIQMHMAVDHDTGGSNSYSICKFGRPGYNAGLCQILLPKVGVPWQFCEINAVCYHAGSAQYGDYNRTGPGFEIERQQGEPLTVDQTHWMGQINRWLAAEWGLPNEHYWGPQFPWWQADFHGSVNHRDIHPNPDGLSPDEWAAVTGSAPVPPASPVPIATEDYPMDIVVLYLNGLTDYFWVDPAKGALLWRHMDANGTTHEPQVVTTNANKDRRQITVKETGFGPLLYCAGPAGQIVRAKVQGFRWVAEYV